MKKTYGELKENEIIHLHGYKFIATEVTRIPKNPIALHPTTHDRIVFKGICTDDKCNDDIRKTSYNGGGYGGYEWVEIFTES